MSFYSGVEEAIAYEFKDKNLLKMALTHSSYANENRLPHFSDNERLEFLGDAVLELMSSEFLYLNFPELPEGDLSKMRAALVCEPTLANVARKLSLGEHIRLSHGEQVNGGGARDSILSDAMEALLGAMYLDGAKADCKRLIESYILVDIEKRFLQFDSKTRLQELVQGAHTGALSYILVAEEGPDHDKTFTMEVHLDERCIGRGSGSSKKSAQQEAAYQGLLFLKGNR
ncbi:MAG: ribonuclease III [Lachnospiraceae bacterium]|nr:ribonuclease III [Lachnospiraceae bacterium]